MKALRRLRNTIPPLSWQHLTASFLVGFCSGLLSYVFFLQTSVFSRRYLLFGIGIASAGSLIAYFLLKQLKNDYFINRRGFYLACFLFFLALPSYWFLPSYPELPFFQRESQLVISISTSAKPVAWSQFRKIFLNSGVEKWGPKGFQISGAWISHGDDFILPPESVGQILWSGRVGPRASLALPIPPQGLTITTDWDDEIHDASVDKSPYVQNKNFTAPLWYTGLIYLVVWILLFFIFIMLDGLPRFRRIALPALILSLSVIQINLQFQMLGSEFHKPMQQAIQDIQLDRHRNVLDGAAPNPWQYRILSEWIVQGFLNISVRPFRLANAAFVALWSLRLLQNFVLLALAYFYFIRLGITKTISIYGVFLLAGGMLHVFHESDLSYNTYFDVIFYLLAAILILDEKYGWLPLLMFPAALNRETSAMIPILLIAWGWWKKPDNRAKALRSGLIGLVIWGLAFAALHLYYPNAPLFKIGEGILPGWELFRYNLSVPKTAILLFQTFGFLPLVGIIAYSYC